MASAQMKLMKCVRHCNCFRAARPPSVRSQPRVQCGANATDRDVTPVDVTYLRETFLQQGYHGFAMVVPLLPLHGCSELANLAVATVAETGIMTGIFFGFDKVIPAAVDPKYLVFVMLLVLSFKSGKLSVLDTRRPFSQKDRKGFDDRVRPSWCPPGPVFGVVWTTIGFLRATSGMLVYEQLGAVASLPIIIFATHLAIGDTWNYVTNTQARLGISALGVSTFVFPSAVAAVAAYYAVDPVAGLTLLPLPIWLAVAQVLTWSIWDLNGKQPLLPRKAADGA